MKKFLAIFLAALMVFTFAACNKESPAPSSEPTQSSESQSAAVTDGEKLELSRLTLIYDADVWQNDEEEMYEDEEYSKLMLTIPDEEESYLVNAEIRVSIEDAENFRDYLASYGFDAYEYAVNKSYDLVSVGGIDCLKQEGNYWGEACVRYFGRVEAASTTVMIEIVGEYADTRVDQLLAGLTVKAEDIGNVDFPWPWDGEPFAASDASTMAGSYTVESKWLAIDECIITGETFEHAVAVAGDKAYILGDGVLKQYAYDGTSLTYEKDLDISGDFGNIQATEDGTIWVSGFMEPLISIKDGVQTGSYEGTDEVTMHPSGSWGISWFSGPECEKFTLSGGAISSTAITFDAVSTISSLIVDEDYIYVCGSAADDSGHKVFVYDHNGNLQMTLCDENGEGLGSITYMAQTENGLLGMDGNMRDVMLWSKDGSYIGSIEDGDLFGTDYPWFCGGTKLDDGSILVIMTEDRADKSAMELIAFKLSGF